MRKGQKPLRDRASDSPGLLPLRPALMGRWLAPHPASLACSPAETPVSHLLVCRSSARGPAAHPLLSGSAADGVGALACLLIGPEAVIGSVDHWKWTRPCSMR